MKLLVALTITAALVLGAAAESRTWTSADGAKTFEGTLHGYIESTGEVTVLYPNGTARTFKIDLLSAEDREWVKANAGKTGQRAAGVANDSVVGKTARGKLHILKDGKFEIQDSAKSPKAYLLMFSASWCGPCRSSAPNTIKLYKEKVENNPHVEWIHVSEDRNERDALAWAKKANMPWLTVLPKTKTGLSKYESDFVPHYVLVSADGKVLATGLSESIAAIGKL